ncbi:helix-turn-helix domain-containing protein [Mycobacteroides abscessus]|uniref:helix-turn-helix domain-containing protein n=1 Tax=Mycobacteroides abscessus TaxID=36809 RepID=UPI000940FC14|nr:helix-turn-helix domain-containing protein [Mycobacteroides abscessus]
MFALDPTASQLAGLAQHASAARWVYNHALAVKFIAFRGSLRSGPGALTAHSARPRYRPHARERAAPGARSPRLNIQCAI